MEILEVGFIRENAADRVFRVGENITIGRRTMMVDVISMERGGAGDHPKTVYLIKATETHDNSKIELKVFDPDFSKFGDVQTDTEGGSGIGGRGVTNVD